MKKILLLFSLILLGIGVFSQEFSVNFTGRLNGSQYQRIDSVKITDVTRNWTETLVYPDTVIVVNATVNVSDAEMSAVGFEQNVPNPFDCYTSVELAISQAENVKLQLLDAAGKQCADLNVALNAGSHRFEITASKPQAYILKAIAGAKTYSVRMINVGSCGVDGIKYGGYAGLNAKLTTENEFVVGDDMEFVGYATIAGNVVESEIVSMQLRQSQDVVLEFRSETVGMLNGHEWVDLGLPSGLLWATCNVGATNPTDYGNYYAWGETTTKETYSWDTYRYCNGSYNTLTKYCNNSSYGNSGFTDELTTLDASDDAATANWGSVWRMPTFDEFSELITSCTVTYLDYPEYEVPGRLFVGPNGNSIFLPRASERSDNDMFNPVPAHYWSSSLYTGIPSCAWQLYFDPDTSFMHYSGYRSYGRSVRPVWSRANDNDSTTISVPTVITNAASNITAYGAIFSGNVISDGGAFVTSRGFMYGTSADNLTEMVQCGLGTGIFVNTIGLDPLTTYYYKAYATNSIGTAYGEVMSFTTENCGESMGIQNGYEWVDLALPSGTRWATCNVGANSPTDYGDYFAWGETVPKEDYSWETYIYGNGTSVDAPKLTKYCNISRFGYNNFTDNLTTIEAIDDAATANWGAGWRMPTYTEIAELRVNCTVSWTTQNGVNGFLFTGRNGNSIFLPGAGYRYRTMLIGGVEGYGNYWSSSLYTGGRPSNAWLIIFYSGGCSVNNNERCCGRSVRPVCNRTNVNDSIVVSMPTVITGTVLEIGTHRAIISGNVISDGGAMVTARGFVYGTNANNLTQTAQSGSGTGNFTANLSGLTAETTYYYKAYATNAAGTAYGEVMSFMTENVGTPTGTLNGHDWIDLGLPSGTRWATCNVGSTTPEGYGDYFAWGETTTKDSYNWSTYIYCNGSSSTLTKYCNNADYGNNGFTDAFTTLEATDDAATANWGAGWRMPTEAEMEELNNNCTVRWTTQNGVNGRLFTGPNGNSIFLPAAGIHYDDNSFVYAGSIGAYWSSSLCSSDVSSAWYLLSRTDSYRIDYYYRFTGQSVRAVCTQ